MLRNKEIYQRYAFLRRAMMELGCADEWFLSEADKVQPLSYVFENHHITLWSAPQYMRQTLYGAYLRVWPSSIVLAKFLVDRFSSSTDGAKYSCQTPLLELGAGVGFCSIATSLLTGYDIIATDGDSMVFPFLQRNCQQTHHSVHPQLVQWGDEKAVQQLRQKYAINGFHCIFGADIVYHKESIPLLASTIAWSLVEGRGGSVFLAFSSQFEQLESQLLEHMEKYAFRLSERQLIDSVFILILERQIG